MRLSKSVLIDARPKAVFDLVSDSDRYDEFIVGVTRWEPRSKKKRGKGARFKILMKVGSIQAGGIVGITA